jgi:hypothetical protein
MRYFEEESRRIHICEYFTEYSKVYSRRYRAAGKYAEGHSGRDLSGEQFKAWFAAAGQARRDYAERNISGEEMPARERVEERQRKNRGI